MSALFELDHYLLRRQVFRIFGAGFHIYDGRGVLVGYSSQKAFKLREDIRLFADESQSLPLLRIRARSILDFSAAYDVVDESTGEVVGTARRRGFRSLLRDSWELLDAEERTVGTLEEESWLMATLRRFLSGLIPQRFHLGEGSAQVVFRQHFNPFIYRLEVDVPPSCAIDRRLICAAAILIAAIEGRQN